MTAYADLVRNWKKTPMGSFKIISLPFLRETEKTKHQVLGGLLIEYRKQGLPNTTHDIDVNTYSLHGA